MISASTTTWSFDGSSLTDTGTYSGSQFFNGNLLYTAVIQDLSIVMGGTASATSFECVEGVFGGYVGASLCGNYTFGGDYINDSNMIYNLGGNDPYVSFPYGSAMDSWYWDGESLILEFQPGTVSRSIHMNFSVSSVPVPAAAWLFGSALIGLVGIKRRK